MERELHRLQPVPVPGELVTQTPRGISRRALGKGAGSTSGSTASEFKRIRITREGWLAIEGVDDDDNVIIAAKPYTLAFSNNLYPTAYKMGGHELSAERETDMGAWPAEDGFFIKVRNTDYVGDANEYWHETIWPPYIGEADTLTSGCRERTAPPPDAYAVVASGNFLDADTQIDDVTLDYYDGGSPVGNAIVPEWTDANFDGRRWVPWSVAGNVLALDAGGLYVPSQ